MPNPPAYQMDSNHDTAIIEIAGYSNHYSDWYVTNSDVTQIHHRYETGPKENDNGWHSFMVSNIVTDCKDKLLNIQRNSGNEIFDMFIYAF